MNFDGKQYNYMVSLVVDVRRTDNQILTDEENKMVKEMHDESQKVIAEIMAKYGQNNQKVLGNRTVIY